VDEPVPLAPRVGRAERRELLLDAAAALVADGAIDTLSMEAVAERAGVSRPLVYKHFANRDELLGAVYRREAAALHDQLTAEVAAADDLEDMFRALVHGALRAAADKRGLFASLRAAGAWSPEVRREQRGRDRTTARAFTRRAVRELGVPEDVATTGIALLLTLVDPVLVRWRAAPTPDHAALLEDTYMTIVSSSLAAMACR
jgi:AcrR family transcriptional regulator